MCLKIFSYKEAKMRNVCNKLIIFIPKIKIATVKKELKGARRVQ